jgi:hypothetical protein
MIKVLKLIHVPACVLCGMFAMLCYALRGEWGTLWCVCDCGGDAVVVLCDAIAVLCKIVAVLCEDWECDTYS